MEPTRKTTDDLLAVQEALIRREPIFHRPEHGTTRDAFESMTADDFWETGASGRRYSRDFVIDTVVKRYAEEQADQWQAEDFCCQKVAPNHYLPTYTLHQGGRVTRRATLWRDAGARWVIVYHQGTIVQESDEHAAAWTVIAPGLNGRRPVRPLSARSCHP